MKKQVIAISVLMGALSAFAELKLAPFYNNDMVLQREQPIVILGQADAKAKVSGEFVGKKATATADADGLFKLTFQPLKAMTAPQTLTVTAGQDSLAYTNILVGDVWLCGGQSNMEMSLGSCNAPDDVAAANLPIIRRIKINRQSATEPRPAMKLECKPWEIAAPGTVGKWTAVGFYFGRRIAADMKVPIGLIDCNWGGTRLEPWLPIEAFATYPELNTKISADYANREASYAKFKKDRGDWYAKNPGKYYSSGYERDTPVLLYNAMLSPLRQVGIKGGLWYQGESNWADKDYDKKMKLLIDDWRGAWGKDLPFYFVQLASFQDRSDDPAFSPRWAYIRNAQLEVLKTVPKTGMAVTIDIGEAKDIHPKNKFDVGERLARWALRDTYGVKNIVVSGPLYKKMQIEKNMIRVFFDYADGLMVANKKGLKDPVKSDEALAEFAIKDDKGKWHWANAVIDGQTVVISSPDVEKPVAARYAWQTNPSNANLYNKEGLPASPFITTE